MKKILVGSMLMVTVVCHGFIAYGDNINENRQRLEQTEQQKTEIKEKLDLTTEEVDKVVREIEEIDRQMSEVNEELQSAEEKLSQIMGDISITEAELSEAEKSLKDREEIFGSRLNVMYRNSSIDYIEVILGATDLVDLFNRLNMVKDIVGYDAEMIEDIKGKKATIEEKSERLNSLKAESEEQARLAETKKLELSNISNAKVAYMEELESDEVAYRSQMDRLESESNRIIKEIMEEEARREAQRAEEARAREEAQSQQAQESAQSQASTPPSAPSGNASTSGMVAPTRAGYVSSEFGVNRGTHMHGGIDIAIPTGTPLVAADSGTVSRSFYSSSYGEVIFINHGNGMVTVYAHNSRRLVSEGERVSKGQLIAYSGNTGRSTGPHLHFEVIMNGTKMNPRNYVNF